MKAKVTLDHEPVADGGWLIRALLEVIGEGRPAEDRTPLNLCLVLDRSGSMSGPKLDAARKAATLLVQSLAPADTLSVVAYDGQVTTVAAPASGDEQVHLVRQIETIRAGGSTNLSGGWLQGRRFVAERAREGAVNRILLLTDGLANQGITDPEQLVGLCRNAAAEGITTTTIGFGAHYDEELLAAMADGGGGGAYYIEEADQAPAVFAEEMAGLMSIAAQNVRVVVTAARTVESCRVLHSYPASEKDSVLTLDLGDLYARAPRPVLAEFLLAPSDEGESTRGDVSAETSGRDDAVLTGGDVSGEASGEDDAGVTDGDVSAETPRGPGGEIPVGTFVIMGDVLTADGGVEERTITVPIRLSPVEGGIAVPEVRRELVLLEAARARDKALEARTAEGFREAGESLRTVSDELRHLDPDDAYFGEEVADLRRMSAAMESGALGEADRKYMKYRSRYTGRGRKEAAESISRQRGEETE